MAAAGRSISGPPSSLSSLDVAMPSNRRPLYLGTNVGDSRFPFLVYALRKLDLPRFACAAVYAAQLFEVNAIDSMRRVAASNLYGILFVATLAWMALALASTRRRQLWIASGGLASFARTLSDTRPNQFLLDSFPLRSLWQPSYFAK